MKKRSPEADLDHLMHWKDLAFPCEKSGKINIFIPQCFRSGPFFLAILWIRLVS